MNHLHIIKHNNIFFSFIVILLCFGIMKDTQKLMNSKSSCQAKLNTKLIEMLPEYKQLAEQGSVKEF